MKRPTLFLDRDGVINIDHGYVYKIDQFDFVEGIFELVAVAHSRGYLVVVVTNQAGIGRGYYTEADFHSLMQWMAGEFLKKGGCIDAVYFCPYHPEFGVGKYRRASDWRKPSPGMLIQAGIDLEIDFGKSIFVGDKLSDMAAGRAAGVRTLLHLCPEGEIDSSEIRINNIHEVVPYLELI